MGAKQDLFKAEKERWLWDARSVALEILDEKFTVTIEDVLERCPRPSYIHRNTVGSVFKSDDFFPVGWSKSRRTAMNGRFVRKWALKSALPHEILLEYAD